MADTILKPIGLIPETDETGQAPAATPALFNGPFGKTQNNFDALEPIVQDVIAAKGSASSLASKMETVESAIGNLETSDAVSVSKAVRLAWKRSDEGYAVEQFSPNMTLIEFDPISVTRTVQGDDSVDVESTKTLKVGNTYVISGNGRQESVTVAEILNATRFKADANLTHTLDAGKMGQTDWQIHAGYAIAPTGGVYYSSAMSVLRYYGNGMLDIRRDNNEGKLTVKVRTKGGGWQDAVLLETVEEESETRNEFYKLPVGGIVELQLVADKEIKVDYLMVYTSPEAGRAYPVAQPANLTPAHSAVSVVDPVTLTGTKPRSLYGIAIASVTVQIATDSNMQNIIHSATVDNPSGEFSYTTPSGTVEVEKNYFWDFYYTDEDGNTSPASKATGFSTASVFEYVVPPMVISPANGSADVMAPLTVRLSDFAAFGSADTHAASRIEASNTPDFSSILFDSGEVAPDADIRITEADGLAVSTDLYLRPYHKGTNLGWSAAGPTCKVRLADAFFLNYWGDGSDGDAVINNRVELPSVTNGDMVVKNYRNLTIEAGGVLTVANQCRGMLLYVSGDLTLNGSIEMDSKGCRCNPADAIVTSFTPLPASDGKGVGEGGLVFARTKRGNGESGSSDLSGCGLAAVAAEANQSTVSDGIMLTIARDNEAGKRGGDGGGPGGPGGFGGGAGGGAGRGGGSSASGVNTAGTGAGGSSADGGGAGTGTPPQSGGAGGCGGAGGLIIIFVKGSILIGNTGKIYFGSPNGGNNGGQGRGGAGGGRDSGNGGGNAGGKGGIDGGNGYAYGGGGGGAGSCFSGGSGGGASKYSLSTSWVGGISYDGGGGGGAGSNLLLAYAGNYTNHGSIENFGGQGGPSSHVSYVGSDGAAGVNLIVQIDV
ncbi:hypothetical protein [Maridesulfovibrio hydrothermalis]|uniref:Uncharacterized protein n=1 Tax=Maridesulfovibrio hydrothermalis AM13 = DSM 14728 TaxID=1121451 RepID=L0RIX9_9BACT|nr:hypothetical protein [Maridesulfovibrio hydrothermalis]CCO25536.1 protein of unknown function [Maridesulfovibrio hydrothermalis AM13 = DSM 14728]